MEYLFVGGDIDGFRLVVNGEPAIVNNGGEVYVRREMNTSSGLVCVCYVEESVPLHRQVVETEGVISGPILGD